jgi:hypothetical protein
MRGRSVLSALLLLAACAKEQVPHGTFSSEDPGHAGGYLILKQARDSSAPGWPGTELHIALASGLNDADQRATVQHVVDSAAAKDTAALWLRVTGFAPGPVVPGKLDVPLRPVWQAIWAPPDTTDPVARSHRAVHRTYFTAIAPPPDTSKRR